MSASNWTLCPKCRAERTAKVKEASAAARQSYGKVPAEEYDRRMKEAAQMANAEPDAELREDYSTRMGKDGVLRIDYSCHCNACSWNFAHKVEINALNY